MKKVLTVTSILLLSGCASRPEDIAPQFIPDSAYSSLDCQHLGEEEIKEGDTLTAVSSKQRRAHKTDTWGVLVTGIPFSELSGSDVAELVAREKGKMAAIHRVQIQKSCPGVHID